MRYLASIVFAVVFFSACESRADPPTIRPAGPIEVGKMSEVYKWLDVGDETPGLISLQRRFDAPSGWTRVDVEDGSFGQFLRGLPVRLDRTHVTSYSGERLGSPSAAIIYIDVGERDLQQCADSAIRLHAEWLWSQGDRDDLGYHFTSGDLTEWSKYASGERFRIAGSKVERVRTGAASETRESFRKWLDLVFMYAGTRSLRHDSSAVEPAEIRPGDFYVAPGSPGHAVIVLDVVEDEAGARMALLGQGFMPAQDLHVIRGDGAVDGVWWPIPTTSNGKLKTPSWRAFSATDARRFD